MNTVALRDQFLPLMALIILLLGGTVSTVYGQEFNCEVKIIAAGEEKKDMSIFNTLQSELKNFMNNRNWIDAKFKPHERIHCSFFLNVSDYNSNTSTFQISKVTIQASRPVYKSGYTSVLLNHVDENLSFTYREYQSLNFNPNTFTSNLTSFFAFYAYFILGLDYDTFSMKGGTPYYATAERIVNTAQSSNYNGWGPDQGGGNKDNRYWLIENMTNSSLEPFREGLYLYHRKGLDLMHKNTKKGRKQIMKSIQKVHQVYQQQPGAVILQLFFNAKSDELVGIFQEGPLSQRKRAAQLLKTMDATHTQQYQKILE